MIQIIFALNAIGLDILFGGIK